MTEFHLWILIAFLLLIFNLVVGFNGLYGQDSFEYLRYSRALHDYFSGGQLPGTFFWPVLYPLSGALVSFILPDVFALQFISILSFGLTFFFLRKILLFLFPEKNKEIALYLVIFFSFSPFVLRFASVVMSDSMTMFFLTAFLYYFLLFKNQGSNRHFVLLTLFAALAIDTRYASVAIIFVPALDSLIRFIRKFDPISFFLALFTIVIVFLPNIILEIQGSPALTGPILIPDWSIENYFHRTFVTPDGNLSYTLPNIFSVFANFLHPGYIFTGILFVVFVDRLALKMPFLKMTVVIILAYALFLAGFATQNLRLLLLTFPCVIVLYSCSFFRSWNFLTKFAKIISYTVIVIVLLLQMALFYRAFRPFYDNSRTVREIAGRMKSYPGKTIYTFNIDMGLRAYEINNEIINIWSTRVDHFKPGSLVLFDYEDTHRQWKDMNPMLNWEKAEKDNGLDLIEKLPGNWNLYEIRN
jgi:hypothetical protein